MAGIAEYLINIDTMMLHGHLDHSLLHFKRQDTILGAVEVRDGMMPELSPRDERCMERHRAGLQLHCPHELLVSGKILIEQAG